MEATLRKEVQDFTHACETLAGFAYQDNGLTEEERDVLLNFACQLDKEVSPHPQQPDQPTTLSTLSNAPLID